MPNPSCHSFGRWYPGLAMAPPTSPHLPHIDDVSPSDETPVRPRPLPDPDLVDALARRVADSLTALLDGRWEPKKDVPAALKAAAYIAAIVAATGHGLSELLAILSAVSAW